MTPHIEAKKEEIAKVVIMPGDPLRAEVIAKKFLTDYKLVNKVRNMFMYTGKYNGTEVTIAGSGMGCASIGIYSYELFKFYDVDSIIRVGSAGAYSPNLKIYDIVNTTIAFGESPFPKLAAGIDSNEILASKKLYDLINQTAKENNIKVTPARVHSSDVFYRKTDSMAYAKENNLDCVEMESLALFANAVETKKNAACLLTISDSFVTKEVTTAEERQNNFMDMIKIALETATKL
ncbi:purine nucleoside phosphorylase [Spiroplasma sabaudiense Ar-1343]|uniref:Uridine phosphorylase n=1 Tax=Spiroplasma sabaudiense Ar-1343 TaxID=1276257 RepID=W6A908_9MOLU|nr:purine-nucleoside phosphorylase [Spiroplasma sabaudiense]AHI53497.1 purine nucleoside phosphorylase [Spiroplasma sabaudiense Ar-1343]